MRCGATAPWIGSASAQIVFKDKRARLDLEAIIHPAVIKAINDFFAALPKRTPFAVADIPLVFETGREKEFDAIIVVACPREMQLQRLMERNKLSKEDAERRLAAQLPIDQKVKKATYVINNDGTFEEHQRAGRRVDPEARREVAGADYPPEGPLLHLDGRFFGGSDPLLDKRIPFVAMRALPEQVGAAVVALEADVRIEEEHRRARRFDVALHQRAIQIELQQHIPDRLVNGEAVRILLERREQELERLRVLIARGQVPAHAPGARASPADWRRSGARHRSSKRCGCPCCS